MVRVSLGLLTGTAGYILPFSAASTVLLPARIAEIDPDNKVRLLAILIGAAAVVALVSNVLFGALSDLTRSRLGARTPWILAGSVGTALLMIPVSHAESFGPLLIWWCLAVIPLNATVASVNAILPDRVPLERRATVSAVIGVAILLGTANGAIVGAVFLDNTQLGLQIVGALFVALAVLAVVLAPDYSNTGSPENRSGNGLDLRGLTASFRFPRRVPDFYFALWGRLLLVLGYFMVNGFQLYIFTDYIGLDEDATARAIGLNSIIFLVTALLGAAVAGPLSDRLKRRKIFVIGASVLAVIAIAVPFAVPQTIGMVGFALVGGVAFGVYYAVDAALMSEVLPNQDSRARDLGILNTATTGGQVLAPAASAVLVGIGIGFAPVFVGAMVACALGAVLVRPIKSVK
jgi:MFS family permease